MIEDRARSIIQI